MFNKIKDFLVNENELDFSWQKFLSIMFLLMAGLMCFFQYKHIGLIWKTPLKFTPGFLPAILGIILISPLYLRGIFKWNRSVYSIISFILILLVLSSFIELAAGGNRKSNIIWSLLAISIVLSWLGIKGVAGLSWILVLASAIYSVVINNLTLGFCGFIYVSFGFLGLLLHSGSDPGSFVKSIKNEYSGNAMKAASAVKTDIEETVSLAKNISSGSTGTQMNC